MMLLIMDRKRSKDRISCVVIQVEAKQKNQNMTLLHFQHLAYMQITEKYKPNNLPASTAGLIVFRVCNHQTKRIWAWTRVRKEKKINIWKPNKQLLLNFSFLFSYLRLATLKKTKTTKKPKTPTPNFKSFCMVQQMGTKAVNICLRSIE